MRQLPIFETGQKHLSAAALNKMSREVRSQRPALSEISRSEQTTAGTVYSPARPRGMRFPWKLMAFGYDICGAVVTIYPGAVRQHGIATHRLDEKTAVTLTGTVEWVYLSLPRNGGTLTVEHAATEPESNAATLKIPLYRFEILPSATRYTLTMICNMGDVNFDTPIR